MKKFKLSFVSLWLVNFLFSFFCYAAGVPFSISGNSQSGDTNLDNPATLTSLITQLKRRAVEEWLQGHLGERFPQFEKSINNDFAERYVLDYKVTRTGARRETLELTGHIDSESLKKWVRLQDTRKATSLKPIVLYSSNLSGYAFTPAETGERLGNSGVGQTLTSLLNPLFQKINAKPVYADSRAPLSTPAKFESDIVALRDYANQMGANAAVWIHLQACPSCNGGARTDLMFYSLPALRLAVAESDDLNAKPHEWNNPERLKAVLGPTVTQFQSGVEGLVSSGQFFSQSMRLVVEGLQNYRVYKAIEAELGSSDFASSPYLKRAGSKSAEFEFLSNLSADEIAQRIQNSEFAGLRVKAQRFDSRTVVMRYSK